MKAFLIFLISILLFSCKTDCSLMFEPVSLCNFSINKDIIIDETFNTEQLSQILLAFDAWATTTNNNIRLTSSQTAEHNVVLSHVKPDYLYIADVNGQDDILNEIDFVAGSHNAKGYTSGNIIYIIPERLDPSEETQFILAVEHEMGHIFMLSHSMSTGSVMYMRLGGMEDCLKGNPMPTKTDIENIYALLCFNNI